jgi:hypothetical protein
LDETELYLDVFTIEGGKILTLKPKDFKSADSKTNVTFLLPANIMTGVYFVYLRNRENRILYNSKVKIAK